MTHRTSTSTESTPTGQAVHCIPFWATIPKDVFGSIRDIKGRQATYIPPDHPTAPLKGGWLVRGAIVNPLLEEELLGPSSDVLCHVDSLKGYPRPYIPPAKAEGQLKPNARPAAADRAA